MKLVYILAASLPFAAIACSAPIATDPTPVCTDEYVYGLHVYVKDSVSNTFIASDAQLITVDQRGKTDTSRATGPDSLPLLGAGEHAGTFTVTVHDAGYKDWVRSGVVVTADQCHVHTTTLTALLQPAP